MENNLPDGWKNSPISRYAEIIKWKGEEGVSPYLEIGDINISNKKYYVKDKPSVKGCKSAEQNDVLVSRVRPTRGAVTLVKEKQLAVSSAFSILRLKNETEAKSLYYQLSYNNSFFNYLGENCTGTMYPTVSEKLLTDYGVNIPPSLECKRIVTLLDAIMEKIESNASRLEKIPKILKRFRQSVLAAAVSGRLTEEWRVKNKSVKDSHETNNKNTDYNWKDFEFPENWKWDFTRNLGEHILGKMLDAAKNKGEPTYYLRNISVRWFEFDLNTMSEMKATPEDKIKFDLRNGDVFICEGGEPGRAAIWNKGKNDLIFQKAIHRIRLNKFVNPYWYLFNLKVDTDSGNLENLFTGTGIKHLTLKSLSKYPISIPPMSEQQEIVRRVEDLFAFADKIEERFNKVKAQIDKLPQAILGKAFRGELVNQKTLIRE